MNSIKEGIKLKKELGIGRTKIRSQERGNHPEVRGDRP